MSRRRKGYQNEKRGTPEDAPPPIKIIGCRIINLPYYLAIIELKLDKSAQAAMQQINLKNYRQRFALCNKPITKVGINFDSTKGNIEDWVIE